MNISGLVRVNSVSQRSEQIPENWLPAPWGLKQKIWTLLFFCLITLLGPMPALSAVSWNTPVTIDSSSTNVGQYTSIAIHTGGHAHISYYDANNTNLKYATNATGSWVVANVDTTGTAGQYSSIAVDSNNRVHISYYRAGAAYQDLKYATNTSGSWVTTSVDTAGNVGQYSSIAVDSNNRIHISYYDTTNTNLKYATNASGAWVATTADNNAGTVGQYSSIAVDSNNRVHISYYDTTNTNLKYATNASGAWVATTVDNNAGTVGQYSSIAVDSNNRVHISYYDTTSTNLKYATNVSGAWELYTESLDSSGNVGQYTSIKVDSNRRANISYYDVTNRDLKYVLGTNQYTVTPSVTGSGTINPSTPQTVNYGATASFTLTPDAGSYIMSVTGTCGGTLVGNTYTTDEVMTDCTVIANFAINAFTVTPSVTGSGTINPSTPQTVNSGATTSFILTPSGGYHIASVTGTCGGTLAGNTYTTNAITANCTVIANFAINTFTVTPSVTGSGTINPSTPQTVNSGATATFTVTPSAGYHIASVGGTCGGSLAGNTYTTNAITANCTVIANFSINTYTVTPSVAGSGGTINPATPQTINYNQTSVFTLTPSGGVIT
jgi:hypothetical protein